MADTGEAPTPLYVDLDKGKEKRGKVTGCGTVLDLCKNKETGEAVEMHWLNADVVFPTDSLGINGGEELFVMKGSLHLGTEQYSKWGWLRFPVAFVGDRSQLRTGSDGAIVFRKTGHLTTKALSMEKIQCN